MGAPLGMLIEGDALTNCLQPVLCLQIAVAYSNYEAFTRGRTDHFSTNKFKELYKPRKIPATVTSTCLLGSYE